MGHHHHHHDATSSHNLVFFLKLKFKIIEVAGGLWTNSIAILADAVHDFGDCVSLGVAWYLQKLSVRIANNSFTYGYRRFSMLGSLVTGGVLVAGLIFVLGSAIERLASPEAVHAPGMLGMAVIGIAFNGVAVWKLSGGQSMNEKVVRWHLFEDVLGWVGVLIGAGIMMIWDLPIIDPLLSILLSLFILWNVIRNLKISFGYFLQQVPASFDSEKFTGDLHKLDGVVSSHHTHCWTLEGEHHVFSTHVVMQSSTSREAIYQMKQSILELLGDGSFEHITIEVELEGERCLLDELEN
jgi:cobalt-zinc-cadmium efflux system protein